MKPNMILSDRTSTDDRFISRSRQPLFIHS